MAEEIVRATKQKSVLQLKNLLLFLPNLVRLCFDLMRDRRVATGDKALFVGAIVYFIMPFDLIPDFLPVIGQMDDAYLIALTLLRLINRTDDTVVRELWRGGGDVARIANSIASLAPLVLPKRVNRALTERVELPTPDKIASTIKNKGVKITRKNVVKSGE